MRTKVFAYNGFIGIESNVNAEGLLNKPLDKGQLGFLLDAKFVDIQPEALELLKCLPMSADDLGEVEIYQSNDGVVVFGWLGGPKKVVDISICTASNDYHPELLSPSENVEVPQGFIDFIDKTTTKENNDIV